MPFDMGDGGVGYSFVFKIDGVQLPSVIDVSGVKLEADKIEMKTQTQDGKYVYSTVMGRYKPGEITVTRQLTQDKALSDWMMKDIWKGNIKTGRKSATLDVLDYTGQKVKSYEFTHVWPTSVETSEFKAGSTDALTEKVTMNWQECKIT
jgi:phage tail-like protein